MKLHKSLSTTHTQTTNNAVRGAALAANVCAIFCILFQLLYLFNTQLSAFSNTEFNKLAKESGKKFAEKEDTPS